MLRTTLDGDGLDVQTETEQWYVTLKTIFLWFGSPNDIRLW